jgi:hypothetical protein
MSSRVLFSMTMQVEAADSDAGQATKLAMTLEASFTGPLDTIAKTGGQRIARSLVTQFGERLNEKLSGEVAAEPAPSRWSRFRLAVAAWLRHWGRGRRTSSDPAASGSAQGVSP